MGHEVKLPKTKMIFDIYEFSTTKIILQLIKLISPNIKHNTDTGGDHNTGKYEEEDVLVVFKMLHV